AQLIDRGVQAVIEIDKRVSRPQAAAQLFARHHISRSLDQHGEHSEGLILQPYASALLAQLAIRGIHFEHAEAGDAGFRARWGNRARHGSSLAEEAVNRRGRDQFRESSVCSGSRRILWVWRGAEM